MDFETKWLLGLYCIKSKEGLTKSDFEKKINIKTPHRQFRLFLNSLMEESIIIPDGVRNVNGNDVKLCMINRKELLKKIKSNEEYQIIRKFVFDNDVL